MLNRQLFVDIRPSSVNGQQLEEMGSSADELLIKVRKPYTITKQRERWTEEEHEKFLEALKLYGRAWRRIQEHIGTKTAIQIRSHAQKFFSKVVRETGTEKSVEIPPPRPKRKPLHPYPRKLAHMYSKGIPVVKQHDSASLPFTSGSEQDSGSPVSVLSGVGSETVASVVSNPPNSCTLSLPSAVGSEPDESLLGEQESGCFSHSTSNTEDDTMSSPGLASHGLIKQDETPMELDSNHVSSEEISPPGQSTCLKLFGKTVLVEESQNRSSSPVGKPQCLSDGTNEKIVGLDMPTQLCSMFGKQNESIGIPENCSWSQWHNGISPLYYCLTPNYYQVNSEQSAITPVPFLWTFVGNLQVPVFGKPDIIMKEENPKEVETSNENAHKEGSFTGSKLESTEGLGNDNCDTKSLDSLNYGVPNKPPCTFKLKPSETSAFTLVKASKSDCIAGYMPNNTDVDGEQVQEYSKKNNREDNQSVSCL